MPIMDGFEAFTKIKQLYQPCQNRIDSGPLSQIEDMMPVIVAASGYSENFVRKKLEETGFTDGYFETPF